MEVKIRDPQVGVRLAKTRRLRGMSQRELGKRSGLSYAYISRIEMGDRNPSFKALRALGSVLEVSAHYLETGDEHGVWVYVTRDELMDASPGCELCATHLAESSFVAA